MLHRSNSLLVALLLAVGVSCATSRPAEPFGAALTGTHEPVPVAEVLATPERYDGAELVLEGTVNEVCLRKGCWMTLTAGEREVRVTFKDYGFFVPTDCAGATVRVEGVFRVGETSAALARHYLHDVGKVAEAEAISAPVKGYTLVASGVELLR